MAITDLKSKHKISELNAFKSADEKFFSRVYLDIRENEINNEAQMFQSVDFLYGDGVKFIQIGMISPGDYVDQDANTIPFKADWTYPQRYFENIAVKVKRKFQLSIDPTEYNILVSDADKTKFEALQYATLTRSSIAGVNQLARMLFGGDYEQHFYATEEFKELQKIKTQLEAIKTETVTTDLIDFVTKIRDISVKLSILSENNKMTTKTGTLVDGIYGAISPQEQILIFSRADIEKINRLKIDKPGLTDVLTLPSVKATYIMEIPSGTAYLLDYRTFIRQSYLQKQNNIQDPNTLKNHFWLHEWYLIGMLELLPGRKIVLKPTTATNGAGHSNTSS